MSNGKLRLQVIFDAVDKLTGPLRTITRDAGAGTTRLKSLQDRTRQFSRALSDLRRAGGMVHDENTINRTRAYENAIKRLNSQIAEEKHRLEAVARSQQRLDTIRRRGMSLAAHGAGALFAGQRLAMGVGALIQPAMEMETAMADVKKVVDFDSPQGLRDMQRDIENLATRIPLARTELAQIVAFGGQAQIPRRELIGFAEDAAKMGVAFGMSAEEAGQSMAQWRTAFRMNREDVNALADRINYLGNTGPANAVKISEMVNRIGALGEVAGLAPGPLAAISASVAAVGVESEVGATGVKNMLLALTAGDAASKSAKAAFAALGLSATDMAQRMQTDASGAIVDVLTRLRQLPEAQRAGVMTQLFGRESIGAIAPLLTNLDLLKTNLDRVGAGGQWAGSMLAEFQGVSDTSASSVTTLGNAWESTKGKLGENMAIRGVVDRLRNFLTYVNAFIDAHPRIAGAIGIGVVAISALLIAFGSLAVGIGTFMMLLPHIRAGFLAISIAWRALNLSFAVSPIGLIISGIAVAAYLIYTYWDEIKAAFAAAWTYLSDFWQRLGPFGRGLVSVFFPIVGVARLVISNWDSIVAAFQWAVGVVGSIIGWLRANFLSVLKALGPLGMAAAFIIEHWSGIKEVVGREIAGVVAKFWAFIDAGNQLVEGTGSIWSRIKNFFINGVGSLISILLSFSPVGLFMRAMGAALAYLRSINLTSIGSFLIQGLINGIRAMFPNLATAISAAANLLPQWFKDRLGIRSPSRVFMALGGHVTDGLAIGINKGSPRALASIARMSALLTAGATGIAAPAHTQSLPMLAATGPAAQHGATAATGTAARGGTAQFGDVHIHIQQRDGESADDLAERVMRRLKALGDSARRGRFDDD